MSIGTSERTTQNRVVAMFREELGVSRTAINHRVAASPELTNTQESQNGSQHPPQFVKNLSSRRGR